MAWVMVMVFVFGRISDMFYSSKCQNIQARMRMMMAQKETIERELAKLQVLLAPFTHTHTHTLTRDMKREGGVSK